MSDTKCNSCSNCNTVECKNLSSVVSIDRYVMPIMKPPEGISNCPSSIAFSMLSKERAQTNHGQTLARLADRGGLCVEEVVAILEDRYFERMNIQKAVDVINKHLSK